MKPPLPQTHNKVREDIGGRVNEQDRIELNPKKCKTSDHHCS